MRKSNLNSRTLALVIFCFIFTALSFSSFAEEKAAASKTSIQVKGSDSEVNLVTKLAEQFMKKNADVSISVTGGGSGVGITALTDKQTDIANSSREMKDKEIQSAKAKGVEPVGIIFAIDGLSVIVNPASKITELTMEDIGKIYKGEITNWKELGGSDAKITLYGRQSSSGTFVFFRDAVVKADYSQSMMSMTGNAQIVDGVKQDKNGIGYVGVGYIADSNGKSVDGITAISIKKDKTSAAISPLEEAKVINGEYPLTRPLYQYINGAPKGKILDFINYELSEEGLKIIKSEGFYPLNAKYIEHNKSLGIGK